ncbi:hypothetical protein T484DRAFT_1908916, partial [Baffinella frigidus]
MPRAGTSSSSSRGRGWSLILLAGLSALQISFASATGSTPLRIHDRRALPAGGRRGSHRGLAGLGAAVEAGKTGQGGWALRGGEGDTEEPDMHLAEVVESPEAWVACPMAGCARFVSLQGVAPDSSAQVECKCGGAILVTKAVCATISADSRRVWRRFCPLDLPLLLPSVKDARDSEDTSGDVTRGCLVKGDATLPPWASAVSK